MHVREIAVLAALVLPMMVPITTLAEENSTPTSTTAVDREVDTFSKLLTKQVELFESEINAKIQANIAAGKGKSADIGPALAAPLPEAKQELNDKEPIVEAIWGMAGKEVAEVVYQGRRIAVSMQEPFISRLDGWRLHSISSYEIVLIKTLHGKEATRKTISLSWGQGSDTIPNSAFMPHRAAATY